MNTDIIKIRDYFKEHDKTTFEHWAYSYLNKFASAPDGEYWKKRCEAAELNIETYSDWNRGEFELDNLDSDSGSLFKKWEEAFKAWQQLKSQEPR